MSDTHQELTDLSALPDPPAQDDQVGAADRRSSQARVDRLAAGADALRTAGRSFIERTGILVIVASVLVTLGLSLVVVGWSGASRSIHVEEQIPYLISGGILGSTLAIIGAFCLFTHWLTVSIREARAREERAEQRHAELLTALVPDDHGEEGTDNGRALGGKRQRPIRPTPRRP